MIDFSDRRFNFNAFVIVSNRCVGRLCVRRTRLLNMAEGYPQPIERSNLNTKKVSDDEVNYYKVSEAVYCSHGNLRGQEKSRTTR